MICLHKNDNGRGLVPDSVVLPRNAGAAYASGTALILSGGVAIAATGANKPQYICYSNNEANEGSELLAYAVTPSMRFEAPITAYSASAKKVGAKVTLSADGKGVTATTTDGVATIVDLQGAAKVGDKIIISFQ